METSKTIEIYLYGISIRLNSWKLLCISNNHFQLETTFQSRLKSSLLLSKNAAAARKYFWRQPEYGKSLLAYLSIPMALDVEYKFQILISSLGRMTFSIFLFRILLLEMFVRWCAVFWWLECGKWQLKMLFEMVRIDVNVSLNSHKWNVLLNHCRFRTMEKNENNTNIIWIVQNVVEQLVRLKYMGSHRKLNHFHFIRQLSH